jgi:hypothetical protein
MRALSSPYYVFFIPFISFATLYSPGAAMIRRSKPKKLKKRPGSKQPAPGPDGWDHCILQIKGRKLYIYVHNDITSGQPFAVFKLSGVRSFEIANLTTASLMTVAEIKFMQYLHKDDVELGFFTSSGFQQSDLARAIRIEQLRGKAVRDKFALRMIHSNENALNGRSSGSIAKITTTANLRQYFAVVEKNFPEASWRGRSRRRSSGVVNVKA